MSAPSTEPSFRMPTGRLVAWAALLTILIGGCSAGSKEESGGSSPADSTDAAAASADSTSEAAENKSWKEKLFGDEEDAAEKDPAVPVETARVDRRDIPAYLGSTATLEAEKRATILSKQSGQILRLRVEEGAWVEKGQVLADLDASEEEVRLEEAAARATGLRLELDRVRSLHERDMGSDRQLNNAEAEFAQAEANRKAMQLAVTRNRVRAPFAGQITERHVDLGQNAEVGAQIFSIVDRSPLLARIHLAEEDIRQLEVGQKIWIAAGKGNEESEGSVLRISPVVDTRTGTVKVTCQLDDADQRLRPGSFVRVKVQTGVHEDVLAIPKRALVAEGADTFVYRAQADSVVKVAVETGFTDRDFVEVIEGLEAGQRIVTVGHGGLKPGSRIDDLTAGGEENSGATPTDTAARDN